MSKSYTNWPWNWARRLTRLGRLACGLWIITKDEVGRIMRRRVKPRFWGFMIAVTLIVFLASFMVMRVRYGYGARQLAQAQSEKNALAAEADVLKKQLDYAQTDEYVMRIARDELNMIMPGEIRYVNGSR
ncbi:MAG: septum formation initiator family protein [Eubacteriales bacterium]